MYGKAVLVIATTVIILLMLFGNSKVRVFSVLVNQIKVFKNAKTEKLKNYHGGILFALLLCQYV